MDKKISIIKNEKIDINSVFNPNSIQEIKKKKKYNPLKLD